MFYTFLSKKLHKNVAALKYITIHLRGAQSTTFKIIPLIQFKPKFKIVGICNYYKRKTSYKQQGGRGSQLCSGLLEQVQIICRSNCDNVLLRMPSGVKYLMTKVQTFYCDIIFLSFPCNSYTTRLKDLPGFAELWRRF